MNRLFLLLAFSMAALGLSAQQRAVYGEFNGASLVIQSTLIRAFLPNPNGDTMLVWDMQTTCWTIPA